MTASTTITYALHDGIATATMDDGKANAINPTLLDALDTVLERCVDDEATALVLRGRENFFSGGIDLKAVAAAPEAERPEILHRIGRAALALWRAPLPTVAAVTGHAVAGGCLLAMACDRRIALDGTSKIGINETALGLVMPTWGIVIAESAVPSQHLTDVLLFGRIYGPAEAQAVGIVHEVVSADDFDARVAAVAAEAAAVPTKAFGTLKRRMRRDAAERAESLVAREMSGDFLASAGGA